MLGTAALVALTACATEKTTDGDEAPVEVLETAAPETAAPETAAPATQAPTTDAPTTTVAPTTTAAAPVPGPPASTVQGILDLGRPVILTHAGGEDSYPHSTPFAFAESVKDGVDVLDIDLRMTGDLAIVVHHDSDTERTADEQLTVYESTFEDVYALDNAYWWTEECVCDGQPEEAYVYRGIRTGEKEPPPGYTAEDFAITPLIEIIAAYPDWVLNMEIKASGEEGLLTAEVLAALLTEQDALDRSIVTSFDDDVVARFHELAPSVAMSPGLDMATEFVLGGVTPPEWARIMQIPPVYEGIEVFTPEYVEAAKAAGLVTWVWPNGEGEDVAGYTALLEMGADGVNASDPAAGVEALRAFLDG